MTGSVTGATHTRAGKFEQASGGTLFLDEIGDMNIDLQAKLLRTLQDKKIQRVGGRDEISVDVRIITATHKNLQDLVNSGKFRLDLYYRLNVIRIGLPRSGNAMVATSISRKRHWPCWKSTTGPAISGNLKM